ncbi:poly [ADP-ribose] polymerase 2 isoform X1 [Cryptomeria japonica]|uniref:poly [ADP-ribose] polymerase 2 isoform X1 n=1 Tax=Cryptomeria japonica TaxID=3369 RepID=UPI0027DAA926|nr:poly [ADP-ribose] polymerase 2 isoform X1 [Cryptomeria japonica]
MDHTMTQKLKVQDLRHELAKRGLDTSGCKPDLVIRLNEAIRDESKLKDGNISSCNMKIAMAAKANDTDPNKQYRDRDNRFGTRVRKERDSSICSPDRDNKDGAVPKKHKLEDVGGKSNPGAGNKELQGISRKKLTPTSKDENELDSSEHKKSIDINEMTVDELRQELSLCGLSTSGTKKVLVGRLGKAMDETPVTTTTDGSSTSQHVKGGGVQERIKENLVVATKKGRAVLDRWLPEDIKSQYHVLQIGDNIYDAMLNQTNVTENNNKFYVIQALEDDSGGKYMVYNRWGRVGVRGQDKLFGPFGSQNDAISEFEGKFFDKTKNSWSERHNFVSYPSKYTWLEMDYEGDDTKKQVEKNPTDSLDKYEPRKSKLDYRVAQFISLICNVDMMKQQMMEIGYNADKLPLGKLSKSTILKGYEVLKRISVAIENQNRNDIRHLSSEFYTVIPHDFGFKKMYDFVIDTPHKLKQKVEMVEALGEIELATKLLKDDIVEDEDPFYSHYQRLHCNILPLDEDSEDIGLVKCYLMNTHAKTHSSYTIEVLHVFKVSRDGEYDRFEKFNSVKNRMLLWHGSRLTNWTGILSQGLRIAPPEAPVTGYMFGKGVYFADMVSKSANYCYASSTSPIGVLLLCEVALGEMVELEQADYNADKLPNGKLSTKGVGGTAPDPSKSHILPDGVIVPLGTPKQSNTKAHTSLLYNEFIVYNVEQIRMRYIVQAKFNFCQ